MNSNVGWLVPPSDPAALADALRAVRHDVVMTKGARAREEYLDKFSPQRFRSALAGSCRPELVGYHHHGFPLAGASS